MDVVNLVLIVLGAWVALAIVGLVAWVGLCEIARRLPRQQ
jgi:hypothetical protein